MVRPIVKDILFLSRKASDATAADLPVARDLLETLIAHREECVGMAANMIGENKRIIAFADGENYCVMLNPHILRRDDAYQTEEGCLSLEGVRPTKRWKSIKVEYQTADMVVRRKTFSGFTAQIIQHEIDHCDGIII